MRATAPDRQRLTEAFAAWQSCGAKDGETSWVERGAADARFHLAIAAASPNAVLLHTIRGLFALLNRVAAPPAGTQLLGINVHLTPIAPMAGMSRGIPRARVLVFIAIGRNLML